MKTGSRVSGQSAAAKYDYISRSGKYKLASQDEVLHLDSGNMPSFAEADPRRYWEAADRHERSNGRLFRSMTVALPNSLSFAAQLLLAQAIAEHVTGGDLPYTLAIHAGRSKVAGVPANQHLHLVFSERVNDGVARAAEQFFRRAASAGRDPASGGARKTERTKPREWLGETREAVAAAMNLAFERAGVDDRVTAESHATQLARAREFGDTAEESRLLLNPPSAHIGPSAKQCWTERGQKLDRYVQWEAGAASAQELQLAHALDEAAAKSEVAELTAQIAAQEAQLAAERRADLEEREETVRTTSKGGQWLDEAHQAALAVGDRELTLDEREQSVETVEGQLEAEFSRLESELTATSAGPALLREEFGDRDARLSFAEWERGLERVEQRVDEELRTQEEMLRSIPLSKQYLSEAEQARADEAPGPPTLAERESMARAVERRVGEELDRRQERLIARAGNDGLLWDAVEEIGAFSGEGLRVAYRVKIIESAEGMLEDDLAELDQDEASLLEDPVGAECLRLARHEVLGADQKTETLVERQKIFDRAFDMAAERRQAAENRVSRLTQLFEAPGADGALFAVLDERHSAWRESKVHGTDVEAALDVAERSLWTAATPWHPLTLKAEQQFPGASSATWRGAGAGLTGPTETDRHARNVSQTLSDRARARDLAADKPSPEGPDPAASRSLVERAIDWLRTRVDRLLQQWAAAAERKRQEQKRFAELEKRRQRLLSRGKGIEIDYIDDEDPAQIVQEAEQQEPGSGLNRLHDRIEAAERWNKTMIRGKAVGIDARGLADIRRGASTPREGWDAVDGAIEHARAERQQQERVHQLIKAANAAGREWGGIAPPTGTLSRIAKSIDTRPETTAAQRAVLKPLIDLDSQTIPEPRDYSEESALVIGWRVEEAKRHQQAFKEWEERPSRYLFTKAPAPERFPSPEELKAARDELVGAVKAAMIAELDRILPRPRPTSKPTRTRPTTTASSAPSGRSPTLGPSVPDRPEPGRAAPTPAPKPLRTNDQVEPAKEQGEAPAPDGRTASETSPGKSPRRYKGRGRGVDPSR